MAVQAVRHMHCASAFCTMPSIAAAVTMLCPVKSPCSLKHFSQLGC